MDFREEAAFRARYSFLTWLHRSSLDLRSFGRDFVRSSVVDIGWRHVVQRFVISLILARAPLRLACLDRGLLFACRPDYTLPVRMASRQQSWFGRAHA
jgi:hypothetical protein